MVIRLFHGLLGVIAGAFATLFLDGDVNVAMAVGSLVGTWSMLT